VSCDRCLELEARIEALLDELHDVKVAAVRERSVERALRAGHPSTRRDDYVHPSSGFLRRVK
jgi:hypothetical protein